MNKRAWVDLTWSTGEGLRKTRSPINFLCWCTANLPRTEWSALHVYPVCFWDCLRNILSTFGVKLNFVLRKSPYLHLTFLPFPLSVYYCIWSSQQGNPFTYLFFSCFILHKLLWVQFIVVGVRCVSLYVFAVCLLDSLKTVNYYLIQSTFYLRCSTVRLCGCTLWQCLF